MTAAGHPEDAVAVGGPMDGAVLGSSVVGGRAAERFEVRMADGSTHLYVRSSRAGTDRGGGTVAYEHAGRA